MGVAHLISIPLTGCGINPARSFGPALIANIAISSCDSVFDDHWVFWFGPILGGLLAAFTYQFILTGHYFEKTDLVKMLHQDSRIEGIKGGESVRDMLAT